ncbi:hypothetical protein M911_00840 [Ectothiorhodospira haloalkaliphila]|uniref:Chemotaxis protein n=1 Tax=Ectothiorhodospira haloalkaliphila TaxID=421628 RepID=W8KLX5_9GAMM|nr:hypothetical protein M911_00840 [Ectothiorhodospira haloalkaliphila]
MKVLEDATILARMISGPIEQVATTLKDIAQGEGDLTRRLAEGGKNELGDLAGAFNAFVDRIHQMVKQIAGASLEAITGSIGNINDMNTQIASAAEEQSSVSEEINRNISNIAQSVDQTASGAGQIAGASDELARLAAELQVLVGRFKV